VKNFEQKKAKKRVKKFQQKKVKDFEQKKAEKRVKKFQQKK